MLSNYIYNSSKQIIQNDISFEKIIRKVINNFLFISGSYILEFDDFTEFEEFKEFEEFDDFTEFGEFREFDDFDKSNGFIRYFYS